MSFSEKAHPYSQTIHGLWESYTYDLEFPNLACVLIASFILGLPFPIQPQQLVPHPFDHPMTSLEEVKQTYFHEYVSKSPPWCPIFLPLVLVKSLSNVLYF